MRWVERFPGPFWVVYLVAAVVLDLALTAALWSAGTDRTGIVTRLPLFLGFEIPATLALAHYLNRSAAKALDEFRPVLIATEAESLTFRYRLVTLPPSAALWSGIALLVGNVIIGMIAPLLAGQPSVTALQGFLQPFLVDASRSPLPIGIDVVLLIVFALTVGAVLCHILRQLAVISLIYSRHTRVNLFRLAPLYALSRQTARTSIGLVLLFSAAPLAVPEVMRQMGNLVSSAMALLLVLAVFMVPLVGVHRLLDREKERLVSENGVMMETAVGELHRRVTSGKLQAMDDMNKAMASLEIERAALVRVPTWPWDPGTLRTVMAALFLPILIWLIQYGLQRFLG